jgi:hypothetical protein
MCSNGKNVREKHCALFEDRTRDPSPVSQVFNQINCWWSYPYLCKIDTIENWKFISKYSSTGGGWKFFSKENVGNVSYFLNSLIRLHLSEGLPHLVASYDKLGAAEDIHRRTQLNHTVHWLVNYCFTSCSRIFHLYGNVTITGEGLQNLGMLDAQGLWEGVDLYRATPTVTHTSVFLVSSEGPPHLISSYDLQWDVEDLYSYSDLHGSPFIRLLRHTRGCWTPFLTRIFKGYTVY